MQEDGRTAPGITADGQLAEGGTGFGIPEAPAAWDRRIARSGGAKGRSRGRRGLSGGWNAVRRRDRLGFGRLLRYSDYSEYWLLEQKLTDAKS